MISGKYKAYDRASHTATKTRQVVMLYDGLIRFLQQAAEAIEKKEYETRYRKLTRASEIVIGLQACLDFESGGNSARILYDFYAMADRRIFGLHRSNDLAACRALIADVKQMRDVWDRIDRGELAELPAAANSAAPAGDTTTVSA